MEEVPPGYVAIGHVGAPWGVRGAVKVYPLADFRELFAPGRGVTVSGQRRVIASARWQKGMVYLRLSGIDARETASALRGRLLAVEESELPPLPEGHYYRFQLIGLAVISTDGEELGRVTDVLSTGANDVYVVRGDRGELLLPATDEVVREINLETGRMLVDILPGLLPEPRHKP